VSESDGFWAGVVEALVPAFVLSHLLMAAVLDTHRELAILQSHPKLIFRLLEADQVYFGKSTIRPGVQSDILASRQLTILDYKCWADP
jgi:hypothetical protein